MQKYLGVLLGLTLCLSSMAERSYIPLFDVPAAEVTKYLTVTEKGRPLNATEKEVRDLLSVSNSLKVETIRFGIKDPGSVNAAAVKEALLSKMQAHPKWDVVASAESVKKMEEHQAVLKKNFGDQSYGQAWFLKQRGDTTAAKRVLLAVFEEGTKRAFQMREIHFGNTGIIGEMELVRQALAPMCDEQEREQLDSKIKKMKSHVSNLPDSNIMT